ncbi:MAG: hypothetical protein EAZ92_00555 [Candidatus Kapaibacterium sp.]|nr:MAG: hypothetical protein EAZ92_00555 [Candidatus Kapabacteria bacterium]
MYFYFVSAALITNALTTPFFGEYSMDVPNFQAAHFSAEYSSNHADSSSNAARQAREIGSGNNTFAGLLKKSLTLRVSGSSRLVCFTKRTTPDSSGERATD